MHERLSPNSNELKQGLKREFGHSECLIDCKIINGLTTRCSVSQASEVYE